MIVQQLLIVRSKIINTIGLKLLNSYQKIVSDAYKTLVIFVKCYFPHLKLLTLCPKMVNFVSKINFGANNLLILLKFVTFAHIHC